jgi:hypothetical protein
MILRRVLSALGTLGASLAWVAPAATQEAEVPISTTAESEEQASSFTSAAQAREYLAQNPVGARAEVAFLMIVDADLAASNPGFDPAQISLGVALQMMPGAVETPETIEAAIAQVTPILGAARRSILPF